VVAAGCLPLQLPMAVAMMAATVAVVAVAMKAATMAFVAVTMMSAVAIIVCNG